MAVVDAEERLGLVVSALAGVREGSPVGLATARALLESRDLTPEQARLRLDAERVILEGIVAMGRGRKGGVSVAQVAPDPVAEPGMPSPMPGGGRFIRKGDAGDHVVAMQARLTELGHAVGSDGKFGDRELRAVKATQKQFGVPQTGVVDSKTLEVMRMPPASAAQSAGGLRSALLAAGQTSASGDVGPNVAALHQELMGLGHEITDPEQTFGSSTAAAVRSVQQRNGLAPTGRADEQTVALISRLRVAAPDPAIQRPTGKGDSMKTKVKEAAYGSDGSSTSCGGIDPFVARTATILGIKPPNLREAPKDAFEACASCVFLGGGSSGCDKYGGYPVTRDDICDSWVTLTPADNRPTTKEDEGNSEVVGDALDGIDPEKIKEAITTKRRDKIAKAGHAMPGNRYPIENETDLENAVKDWVRTGRPGDVGAWIRKSAKRLGVPTPDALAEAGIPSYVERIARFLHESKGKEVGEAIAIAVNTVKRWASSGTSEASKARAVVALEQWESGAQVAPAQLSESQLGRATFDDAAADFGLALALYESAFRPIPPSLRFASKLLEDMERGYDDWGRWAEGSAPVERTATMTIYAQESALAAAPGYTPDPSLTPFVREVGGTPILFVAGVPVRLFESYGEAAGAEAGAQSYDAMSRSKNATRTKHRTASRMRKGFHPGQSEHNPADLGVHARVSGRFAGSGAIAVPIPVQVPPDIDAMSDGDMDADDIPTQQSSFSSANGRRSLLEVAEGIVGRSLIDWDRIAEAVDSLEKATVHSPIGPPDGPGLWKHKGMQLPAYVQHIAKALMKDGHPESEAIGMAVGIVKRWARGGGKVDSNTRAAASKAVADWERAKASAHAKTATKDAARAVKEAEAIAESFTALFNPIKHPRGRAGKFADVLDHIDAASKAAEPRPQLGDGESDMVSRVAGYGRVLPQDLKADDHFRDMAGAVYRVKKTEAGRAGKVKLHLEHDVYGVGPTPAGSYSFEPVDQGFRRHTVAPSSFDAKPPVTASSDAQTVDQAIGNLLSSYPGLEDWNVSRLEQPAGWHVKVQMAGPVTHHFHVGDDGTVGLADETGKPKDAPAPKPAKVAKSPATPAGGYELTGEHEKPYHMQNGQVFQGKKGGWFEKLDSGKMTSEKGWNGAGVHVHDLATGDKKWVPAFAMKDHLPLAGKPGSFKKPEAPSGDLFGELMSSVKGGDVGSFAGKNVVVTGKIPGYTRDDVHGMIAAKGGVPHSSVSADTHVLITGEKVGATKTNAAKAKGVKVMAWDDAKHLLESDLTPRVRRLLAATAELAEGASPADSAGLSARLSALDGQLTRDERKTLASIRPTGLSRFGIVEESVATVRRK